VSIFVDVFFLSTSVIYRYRRCCFNFPQTKSLTLNYVKGNARGEHSLIWAIRGSATGSHWHDMVYWPRCPKQGHTNPECEHGLIDGFLFSSRAESQRLDFRCIEHYFSDLTGLLNNFKRKCS